MLTTDLIVEELRALSAKMDLLLTRQTRRNGQVIQWVLVVGAVVTGWLMGRH